MSIDLQEVDITGVEEHPEDESVKLHGPPGTGKTTQSAARVARLIEDHDYGIQNVAWCTYRRSLAMDSLERLANWGIIPRSALKDPRKGSTKYISTIHAVANRIAGEDYDVVQYGHKKDFCNRRNMKFTGENAWEKTAGQLLFQTFDYAANNLLDPMDREDLNNIPHVDDLRDKWRGDIGKAWWEWQEYKDEKGIIDYHEMLKTPLDNGTSPQVNVLVVDEYHDATPLMAKLTEMWMDDAEIVIVAGDPNQVVNSYAGADPKFFHDVELPEILLDKTYRVPHEHWHIASNMLAKAHTPPPVSKESFGGFAETQSPNFLYDDDKGWKVPGENENYSPPWFIKEYGEDIMFLTRTQKQADGICYALEKAGMIYKTQNSMSRDGWEVRGEDISDRTAIYNSLQKIKGYNTSDFGGSRGGGLKQWTETEQRPPSDTRLQAEEITALLDHTDYRYLANSRSKTTEILRSIDNEGASLTLDEVDEYVTDEFWQEYTKGVRSVTELNRTGDYGKDLSARDIKALKEAVLRNDNPINPPIKTRVYTIHGSKGAEAENVIVYDGITKRIQKEIMRKEEARDNEWRTWYVALSRASERLIVLRNAFEWTQSILPENLLELAKQGQKLGKKEVEG